MIVETMPEPTVWPPSRIAKRRPSSMAIGVDQVALDGDVVTRHSHLGALGQGDDAGNVGGTEVELRTITIEERGVTAALLLGQNVDLAGELGVRGNRTGLAENLAALDVLALDAAEQSADVVASLAKSRSLRNISIPVTTVFWVSSFMPTISTGSLSLSSPRSTRPVATVPRPEMVITSSTAIRKGWSLLRAGVGM